MSGDGLWLGSPLKWKSRWENHLCMGDFPALGLWCQIPHFLRRFCGGKGVISELDPPKPSKSPWVFHSAGRRRTTAGLHFGPSGCVAWDSDGEAGRIAVAVCHWPWGPRFRLATVSSTQAAMHWRVHQDANGLRAREELCVIVIWCYMTYVLDRIYVLWQCVSVFFLFLHILGIILPIDWYFKRWL